ncbi:MAG: hypothetical protein HEQ14_19660 [Aphanizomenon flos-aquae CP01]|nr:hypothetical protein [Aphanizomenon flos-aquae CP01]
MRSLILEMLGDRICWDDGRSLICWDDRRAIATGFTLNVSITLLARGTGLVSGF